MDSAKGETKDADVKCEADTKEENTEKNTCPKSTNQPFFEGKQLRKDRDFGIFGESSDRYGFSAVDTLY
ncbi:hypothetical protein MAR_004404 [Mya arenaria]|uniref:Uncharacterized protein n=1 Tax=Mya arenaria TaxID=6604 RepID=A0ABY7F0M8_MYAAR|nr:hypothetical protein MAR_004404 [Mya arenaria]